MRMLKTKIALARRFIEDQDTLRAKELDDTAVSTPKYPEISPEQPEQPKKRVRVPGQFVTPERDRATKNIVKNYGKAICSFACSDIGRPYVLSMIEKHPVKVADFLEFAYKAKDIIDSIVSFRNILLVSEGDDDKTRNLKRILALVSEVFIKYFSVNWIFSGRITYKEAHLKFRFKLLRKIQNPEDFMSLKAK